MRIEDFQDQRGQGPSVVAAEGALGAPAEDTAPLEVPDWQWPAKRSIEGISLPWIDHFSGSQLYMAEVCPEQYRCRYVLGIKEPPGQSLVLGTLAHEGIEYGLTTKQLTEENPDLDDLLIYYGDAVWPDTIQRYGGEGEIIWDDKPEKVRERGGELVTAYHPRISLLEPEAVEYKFSLDLGFGVPIIGFIDLKQQHGRPSIDFKTTGKRRPALKSDWRAKARVYQLAVPRAVDHHQIVHGKQIPEVITGLELDTMIEDFSPVIAEQTKKRIEFTLRELSHYYETLGPDTPWPQRGVVHDWRCDPKWCAYRKRCPAWLT